ncbi:MAG: beta-propeller domain-containing protein, methanol dehydrogenase [Gemmatimonadetes bacterium]|nr:MAG: beta-propeller domain-containing protein, methanol dehydrogenase [Gemmatimonadota bacterium]
MEAVIGEVREKTRGEIAVVTLADIGDRSASDVALQIGRQWGVGAKGDPGDRAKNAGVVVLLIPRKNHRPGTGDVFISVGRGAEGFLTDARAGRIRDAMLPALGAEDYGTGLALGVDLIAQAFAAEFGITLTNPQYAMPQPVADDRRGVTIPSIWLIAIVILLLIFTRGRILWLPFWIMSQGRGGGGWSGGGGWGGGGGRGGGGFGGFGGGGGFSGGGAGGRF